MPAASDINPSTGKAYAINPQSGVWDDNYFAKNFGGSSAPTQSTSSSLNTDSIIKSAQQMQEFYKQQNQPVIQSYEASKAPLEQRYKDLITSIKGNQQVAENRQTLTTNTELGKRGITGSSGLAQQEITSAVNPITQQYTGMLKDTTNQQNIDIAAINKAIAQLQAGNPESSVSAATGISSAQQAANQFQQQMEATQKQNAIENTLKQLQLSMGGSSQDRFITIGDGAMLYDTQTGRMIENPKNFAGSSGGDVYE